MRLRASILAAVVGLASILFFVARRSPENNDESFAARVQACITNECLLEVLSQSLDIAGPQATLRAYLATSPVILGAGTNCHQVAHQLGQLSWEKFGVTAWVPSGNICNYGYYHGALVAMAESSSVAQLTVLAKQLCEDDPLPSVDLPRRECAHGFGHAVFTVIPDAPSMLSFCDEFTLADVIRRCQEGVAMEVIGDSPTIDKEQFAKCYPWSTATIKVCIYVTASYLVLRTPILAKPAVLCQQLFGEYVLAECLRGAGYGVSMRSADQSFATPGSWALAVCTDSSECAFGFGKGVFYLRNDLDWSYTQCAYLPGASKESCVAGVDATAATFRDQL